MGSVAESAKELLDIVADFQKIVWLRKDWHSNVEQVEKLQNDSNTECNEGVEKNVQYNESCKNNAVESRESSLNVSNVGALKNDSSMECNELKNVKLECVSVSNIDKKCVNLESSVYNVDLKSVHNNVEKLMAKCVNNVESVSESVNGICTVPDISKCSSIGENCVEQSVFNSSNLKCVALNVEKCSKVYSYSVESREDEKVVSKSSERKNAFEKCVYSSGVVSREECGVNRRLNSGNIGSKNGEKQKIALNFVSESKWSCTSEAKSVKFKKRSKNCNGKKFKVKNEKCKSTNFHTKPKQEFPRKVAAGADRQTKQGDPAANLPKATGNRHHVPYREPYPFRPRPPQGKQRNGKQ